MNKIVQGELSSKLAMVDEELGFKLLPLLCRGTALEALNVLGDDVRRALEASDRELGHEVLFELRAKGSIERALQGGHFLQGVAAAGIFEVEAGVERDFEGEGDDILEDPSEEGVSEALREGGIGTVAFAQPFFAELA